MLGVCAQAELSDGSLIGIDAARPEVERHWHEFSDQGRRVLGVAYRDCGNETHIKRETESDMIFLGFIVLSDPPKLGIGNTLRKLSDLGISLKIITGDNVLIAGHVAREIGLGSARILAGPEMRQMSNEALMRRASEIDVFAEIEPIQKERIVMESMTQPRSTLRM